MFFQNSHKLPDIWAAFVRKFVTNDFNKIAKAGHWYLPVQQELIKA